LITPPEVKLESEPITIYGFKGNRLQMFTYREMDINELYRIAEIDVSEIGAIVY
jgi:hypothetical protein